VIRPAIAISLLLCNSVCAETVYALRSLSPNSILTEADLVVRDVEIAGMATSISTVVGKETRVAIYAGRPIRTSDLSAPALVQRNAIVELRYTAGGLRISAEGRSLDRGSVGERIRVMNLSSRSMVFGVVSADGSVLIAR